MFCLLFRYFPRGIRTMAKEDWTWYYYYTMKYGFEIVNVLLAIDRSARTYRNRNYPPAYCDQ